MNFPSISTLSRSAGAAPVPGGTAQPGQAAQTSQTTQAAGTRTDEMGQQAFLKLFTTQLQNQDPLDPVKNEAFVAQLAQFSQLEATTRMADSVGAIAGSLQADRILTGAALIGKRVVSPNGSAELRDGATIQGLVSVPAGANSVRLDVYDEAGRNVFTQSLGRQAPGDVSVRWAGTDQKGQRMPAGRYQVVATVDSFGQVSRVPITTPATVQSVTYSSALKELVLELQDGSTVPLSQVSRVDG